MLQVQLLLEVNFISNSTKTISSRFITANGSIKNEHEVKKMTKSQCYNAISRNQQLIKQYQNEINTLNREINELNEAKSKVSTLKSTLSSCKNTSVNRLSSTNMVMKINSKIVSNFCNNMNTLFAGAEYNAVNNGLISGIAKIEDEIKRKQKRIRTLENMISDCHNRISDMNSAIRRIEAQEIEEARRKAEEEARRKAEEANKS